MYPTTTMRVLLVFIVLHILQIVVYCSQVYVFYIQPPQRIILKQTDNTLTLTRLCLAREKRKIDWLGTSKS
jgi:hypothetical protein